MAQGGQITWVIDADKSHFDSQLASSSAQAKAFGNNLSTVGRTASASFARDMGSAFDSVATGLGTLIKGVTVAGVAGSVGFGAMAKAAFDQVRQVENATFSLKAYEKNADKVNTVLKDLVGFARSDLGVLFNREDLFEAASTLKIYGQSTDTLVDKVKLLSRGVAIGKTTFGELSQIIGRAAAKGRLDAVDFDMLIERGIGLDRSFRGAAVTSESLFKALEKALPVELLEGRANSIDGVMIRLKSAFRDLGGAILGVDKETSKFVAGGLGDRFVNLLKDLRNTLASPEIKTAFATFGKQIGDFAERALPLLIDGLVLIAKNMDNILPAFAALIAMFAAAKLAAIGFAIAFSPISLTAFILAAAITAIVGILTFLQIKFDIFGKALDVLRPALEYMGDLFRGLWNEISELARIIGEELSPILQFLKDNWDIVKFAVLGFIFVALLPVIGFFAVLIGTIKAVTAILSFVSDNFTLVKNAVLTLMFGALGPLINFLWNSRDAFMAMARAAADAFNRVKDKAYEIRDSIISFFAGAAKWLYDAGRNLITGFADGIKGAANVPVDAAKGVVNKVKQWLPGSPAERGPFSGSGWTPFRGKALVEGFAQGISQASGSAISAASSLAGGISGSLNSQGTIGIGSTAPSMSAEGFSRGSGSSNQYHIGTINIAKEVDGQKWLEKLTRDHVDVGNGLVPSRTAL